MNSLCLFSSFSFGGFLCFSLFLALEFLYFPKLLLITGFGSTYTSLYVVEISYVKL